ncbi:hypothetical protein GJV85_07660 [Sulfurimonas aquatica]|uniref:Uncharacterized protein n=1 Tax=Sulfurimonas aquatica TaxID=2672570 RepID=A0A975B0H9_9BACT|nr:hypothetical protein [Sulfurimonas aquatica]QSZ41989.1 hypothetical protein GJV85_07660 [Sulfurimonas aquatica]
MSSNQIAIKPNNHRVYQCPNDKKMDLLNDIIAQDKKLDILVVTSGNAQDIIDKLDNKEIKVMEDKDLVKDKELSCQYLISYDLPIKAIVYMARISKATQQANILLDQSEQRDLHQIEMLLGRAIKQEVVEGYEYPVVEKVERPHVKKLSKEEITEIAKKRHEDATVEKKPKSDKPKREGDDKWAKKKKDPNKFLGKDENGKAIFSGKSGERNHGYDGKPKERYTAPTKVGKKISIKARKPKEESSEPSDS